MATVRVGRDLASAGCKRFFDPASAQVPHRTLHIRNVNAALVTLPSDQLCSRAGDLTSTVV